MKTNIANFSLATAVNAIKANNVPEAARVMGFDPKTKEVADKVIARATARGIDCNASAENILRQGDVLDNPGLVKELKQRDYDGNAATCKIHGIASLHKGTQGYSGKALWNLLCQCQDRASKYEKKKHAGKRAGHKHILTISTEPEAPDHSLIEDYKDAVANGDMKAIAKVLDRAEAAGFTEDDMEFFAFDA